MFYSKAALLSCNVLQEVYDTRGKGMVLSYRYDCESVAPTCIAAHPGEPILAVGVDHNLLILQVGKMYVEYVKYVELSTVGLGWAGCFCRIVWKCTISYYY